MSKLLKFIEEGWDKTLRYTPEDDGNYLALPKPFTVPCIDDKFNELETPEIVRASSTLERIV